MKYSVAGLCVEGMLSGEKWVSLQVNMQKMVLCEPSPEAFVISYWRLTATQVHYGGLKGEMLSKSTSIILYCT